MIEFYKPDRHTNPAPEAERETKTVYAEPEDIRIVVDNETPPRDSDTFGQTAAQTRQGSIPSPASAQQNFSTLDDIAETAKAYGEKIMEEINPGAGGFNRLKNRNISILLCALFGIFGAHRFYEGKIATGILWACTVGGFGIGWIIDLIILINKPKYYEP